MDWNIVIGGIWDHILIPVLIAIGVGIAAAAKYYADKISKSVVARNELASMEKENTVRKDLLTTLSTTVEAAVASNMQLANVMKKNGNKLTDDQISELNRSAKQLVLNTLPPSLTEEGGVLLEIIGGRDRLDAIISSMMEKYVYEYKIKSKTSQESPINTHSPIQNRRL